MSKHIEILEQNGYHFLWIDGQLWMWDIPAEVELQKAQADEAYGDVLVAGYGLGIVQEALLDNEKVKSVLTIEIEPKIKLVCGNIFGTIYGRIVIDDFYEYQTRKEYDCIIGDIWPEISGEHLDLYKKFKEKAKTMLKSDGIILGWGVEYYEYLIKKKQEDEVIEELLRDLPIEPSRTHHMFKRVIKRMYEKLPRKQFFDEFAMYLVTVTNPNRKS